jgi:hypothetical protein
VHYKGYFPEELDIHVGKSFFPKAGMEMESPLVVHIFSGTIDPLAAFQMKEWLWLDLRTCCWLLVSYNVT